jgi:hypothetical protein
MLPRLALDPCAWHGLWVWFDAIPQRNCGRFSRPSPSLQSLEKEPRRRRNLRTASHQIKPQSLKHINAFEYEDMFLAKWGVVAFPFPR